MTTDHLKSWERDLLDQLVRDPNITRAVLSAPRQMGGPRLVTKTTDMRAELLAEVARRERLASRAAADLRASTYSSTAEAMFALDNLPPAVLRQLAGVRAVVEMHSTTHDPNPDGVFWCNVCVGEASDIIFEAPPPEPWPCPTIRALYDAYCGGPDDSG